MAPLFRQEPFIQEEFRNRRAEAFLDALDDLIIEDTLALTGDELRAEIIAEGGDPDAMVREASAAIDRAVEAARSGYLLDRGDQPIPRLLGLPDPFVTRQAAAVEQPLEDSLRLDEGAPHPPQRALADLLPKAPGAGAAIGRGEAIDVAGGPARGRRHVGEDAQGGRVVLGRADEAAGLVEVRQVVSGPVGGRRRDRGHLGFGEVSNGKGDALAGAAGTVWHAPDSEAVPEQGQAWTDAEKAPAGALPAVWSAW
jgi:hypothetical protein